ncbi:hypothetical protein S245_036070, partial [Arachis hypogaea]
VEEFVNEVVIISRTSHLNIISVLGFCYAVNKQQVEELIKSYGTATPARYNYAEKKLGQGVYGIVYKASLNHGRQVTVKVLKKLGAPYQLTISVARGLDYLYRGCNTRIFHLYIKAQNNPLDENFCPKITDLGLTKIYKKNESIVSILGTKETPVSRKSDMYSYGMLILKIIGKKYYDTKKSHSSELYYLGGILRKRSSYLISNLDW